MIKNMLREEMPREKLIQYGKDSLTQVELLALLLKTGTKDKNVLQLSREILTLYSPIELVNTSVEDFMKIKGISTAKACELVALFELSNRVHSQIEFKQQFSSSQEIYNYYKPLLESKLNEELRVIFLNSKQKLLYEGILAKGSVNYIQIDTKHIVKKAVDVNAVFVVLIHNHPSGDSTPSSQDIEFTKKLLEILQLLDIKLIDHLIIGKNNYISFFDENIIEF